MTSGQQSRRERDLVIAAAAVVGVSERMLSRVFGMQRSQVHRIIAGLREEHATIAKRRPHYREAFKPHSDGRKSERPRREE